MSHCLCVTCDFGQKYVFTKSDQGSRFEKLTNAKLLGSHCIPHKSCRKLSGGHFGTRVFRSLLRFYAPRRWKAPCFTPLFYPTKNSEKMLKIPEKSKKYD
eukprot:sb/3478559/